MRYQLVLACMCCAACGPVAPKPLAVEPDAWYRPPFEGPFETDPTEITRIYEAVLTYEAAQRAKIDSISWRNGTLGKGDSSPVRLDVRIGRYFPGGLVTTGEHDSAWVRSVIGRMGIVGSCPNGIRRTCKGSGLVLSQIRRPDSTTAEVEMGSYWLGPPRRGGAGSGVLVLKNEGGVWRVVDEKGGWMT